MTHPRYTVRHRVASPPQISHKFLHALAVYIFCAMIGWAIIGAVIAWRWPS
jgi:hypothetical protein